MPISSRCLVGCPAFPLISTAGPIPRHIPSSSQTAHLSPRPMRARQKYRLSNEMRRQPSKRPRLDHTPLPRHRIPMVALVQTLAVAEYLSFHRAALALGTNQSSVSARIKALEADLGVILFDRNPHAAPTTTQDRREVA